MICTDGLCNTLSHKVSLLVIEIGLAVNHLNMCGKITKFKDNTKSKRKNHKSDRNVPVAYTSFTFGHLADHFFDLMRSLKSCDFSK